MTLTALAYAAGLLLPIYTDEVGWRFQERAGFDGVDKAYSESCGLNSLAAPPAMMMPVRWYSALFNAAFADPLYIRLSGILYAFAWLAMLLALVRRLAPEPARRDALTIIGLGLMGLGLMPLLLVWSRPEQPILLALTGALLIAFPRDDAERPDSAIGDWLRALAIPVCALIAFSYHFKTLMLIPAFALAIWLSGSGRRVWPRLTGLLLLAVMTVSAKNYWFARLACPDDPILAAVHAGESLGLQMLGGRGLLSTAAALIGNLNLIAYVKLTAPGLNPMSHWLPADLVSRSTQAGWRIVLILIWAVALLTSGVAVARAIVPAIRRRRLHGTMAMAVILFGTACAWCASQLSRNVYEARFVLPLLMLAFLFALARGGGGALQRARVCLAIAIGAIVPVSMALVMAIYGPALVRSFGRSAYVAGQEHSIAVYGYRGVEPAILAAARACGIAPGRRDTNLLVDELTYFAFLPNPLPQHYLGVLPKASRGDIADPIAYLNSRNSRGAILACGHLPGDLRARARRDGQFCCLAPPEW